MSIMAKPKLAPIPRRSSEMTPIAAGIAPQVSEEPAFEKVTLTGSSELRERARFALIKFKVSESALHDVALRLFLNLPEARQREALRGFGRRRKV